MTRRSITSLALTCATIALGSIMAGVAPLDATFTYNGVLTHDGAGVNVPSDFWFRLYDDELAGAQVGPELELIAVPVVNGLFTVELDFGVDVLDGAQRWLEIDVATPTNSGKGETLAPRQRLTGSPYAIQTRGVFLDDANNAGLGTTAPQRPLHIQGLEAIARLSSTDTGLATASRIELQSADAQSIFSPLGSVDFLDEAGDLRASVAASQAGPTSALITLNIMGSPAPQMRVTGTGVEFGPHHIKPPIAYGKVDDDGTLVSGSSNITSIDHSSSGHYRVFIDGGVLDTDITITNRESTGFITSRGVAGSLLVVTTNTAFNDSDTPFSFVIYRP